MGKIYITRHGETEWNTLGKMQGWSDSPLTSRGIKQAEWLFERLKEHKIDYIYSSSSGRAYETAQILNRELNLEITKCDEIREIFMGDWQGIDREELLATYGDMVEIYWTRPHEYINDSGEKIQDVIDRSEKFLRDIMTKHKEDNVLIVTHTVTLKCMLLKLENKTIEQLWTEPFIKQTCLTILDHDGIKPTIELHADASHHREEYVKNVYIDKHKEE